MKLKELKIFCPPGHRRFFYYKIYAIVEHMEAQKIYYITGAVFFILASVLALAMLMMMFGGGIFGFGD